MKRPAMKRSSLIFLISGGMIMGGFALSVYGSQLITENVSIEENILQPSTTMSIQMKLDPTINDEGRYVAQITDFNEGILDISVLGPNDISLISKSLTLSSLEEGFIIDSAGDYILEIRNAGEDAVSVVGAIGYLPPNTILALSAAGLIIVIIGLGGIVIGVIYFVKTKLKNKLS